MVLGMLQPHMVMVGQLTGRLIATVSMARFSRDIPENHVGVFELRCDVYDG